MPAQTPAVVGEDYVLNGDMEDWTNGGSAAPDNWVLSGASATVARNQTFGEYHGGESAAALTRAGADAALTQQLQLGENALAWWQGRRVTLTAWVRATVAARARIVLDDGTGTTASSAHSGGSGWEQLTVSRTLSASATTASIICQVITGDTTAQFDDVVVRVDYFSIGGLWCGTLTTPPGEIKIDRDDTTEWIYEDIAPRHRGWSQRLRLGEPVCRLNVRRIAATEAEVEAWRVIDRAWEAVDVALVCLRPDLYTHEAYIMKRVSVSRWTHGGGPSESDMELEEVTR
jgi:hypothetical protein